MVLNHLESCERKGSSQNGEDDVLAAIFAAMERIRGWPESICNPPLNAVI